MASKKSSTQISEPAHTSRSTEFRSLYTNNVQIQVSFVDFRIIFGEASNEDNTLSIEQKIGVVMSPQQAKVLSQILSSNIALYEQRMGNIVLPPLNPPNPATTQ